MPPKRIDRREKEELNEQRRLGLAELERDVVTGKELAPTISDTFTNAPWFYKTDGPTLAHQAKQETTLAPTSIDDTHVTRQLESDQKTKKFQPGACTNCGSKSHKTKECTERKRKVGAKFQGSATQLTTVVSTGAAPSFEQKRDRWAGADSHDELWKRQQAIEEQNRATVAEEEAMSEEEVKAKRRRLEKESDTSSRALLGTALRDQDSLPKYLQTENKDAYYDPRSRALRENKNAAAGEYKGDDVLNFSGAYRTANEQRLFLYQQSTQKPNTPDDSALLQTKSMFLPTANEAEFKAHKAEIEAKKRKEEELVKSLYGAPEESALSVDGLQCCDLEDTDDKKLSQ